jgi:hypothetical protein
VAEGGAGLETNARDNALDTETTDELASPPPYKEVSKVHLSPKQIMIMFLHLSTLKVDLTDFSDH